jgi:septal ring factor EnvC (AmiA/AmiB activator)
MRTGAALAALWLLLLPALAWAAADPAQIADRAALRLEAAAQALARARSGSDRVAALTATVRAYEEGLSALREGLRQAERREAAIRARFAADNDRLAALLGVLQTMQAAPEATLLLHPSGALGTARAGMLVADVAPAVAAEVAALRRALAELAALRRVQAGAQGILEEGLNGIRTARTELSQAIERRTDLPRRAVEDDAQLRRLVEGADTLAGFASGFSALPPDPRLPVLPDFAQARGNLALPVQGRVLRRFRALDAAGIRRPGWVIATRPGALVTAPWSATIRYRGPLLDYGNVMVLEPSDGYLMVLAGLDEVYGDTGDVLPADAPLGLMPGAGPESAGYFAARGGTGDDGDGAETLYVELRAGGAPVDPADWFRQDED